MTAPNTRHERVDALTNISDQLYPILEQQVDGEMRARRIVRLGLTYIAYALNEGMTPSHAGTQFDQYFAYELRDVDYGAYNAYRTPAIVPPAVVTPSDIANLANRYSDTLRGTYLADCTHREPDSIHALHLAALAVPYARAHYPQLDAGKIALYSLLHDLPEAYAGDTETFNISPEGLRQKQKGDATAVAQLRRDHGNKWAPLVDVIDRYESLDDDEAAFTKTKDKNDPGYTHFRNSAYALKYRHGVQSAEEFYHRAHINTLRTLGYASQFALILEDKEVLTERIAALLSS